jgi:hypothetical protein
VIGISETYVIKIGTAKKLIMIVEEDERIKISLIR